MGKVNDEVITSHEEKKEQGGMSRRGFLASGGVLAGGALAASLLGGCAPNASGSNSDELGGIKKAKGHIKHVSEICTGCRTCELSCVLTHEQLINPRLARNTVYTDVQAGHVTDVLYCQQCDDPKCLQECPTGALHVDDSTGARVIDQDVCIGCQTCLNACIFAPVSSRIKYNEETNTCFKCDLCGGDPICVKRCPLGASQLSWEDYTIFRPGIDDYVETVVEGAIEGIVFEKDYSGAHAGKAMDEQEWALLPTDTGVKVAGQITSSDGAELRVKMSCDFYDAAGSLLGTSNERQWKLIMHDHLPLEFDFDIADPSQIAKVVLVGNVGYWVAGVDEEY